MEYCKIILYASAALISNFSANSFFRTLGGTPLASEDWMNISMPSEDSFVEYQDLTEQNLIDWYTDGIREEMAKYEIQNKFNLNVGTETTNFPW